jgi:hypothetical protein
MIISERANIIAIPLLKLARVLVRVDHIASFIVKANHSVMRFSLAHLRKRNHVVSRRLQDGFLGHVDRLQSINAICAIRANCDAFRRWVMLSVAA